MMISRVIQNKLKSEVQEGSKVILLFGARQVGKTTLARWIGEQGSDPVTHFDLEKPSDLARLQDPQLALEALKGLVILDEIQRLPDLFPLLRVLADRPGLPARFLARSRLKTELELPLLLLPGADGTPNITVVNPAAEARGATRWSYQEASILCAATTSISVSGEGLRSATGISTLTNKCFALPIRIDRGPSGRQSSLAPEV